MQIASITPMIDPSAPIGAAAAMPAAPAAQRWIGAMAPSAPTAPASIEGATDGVARLTTKPIVDFPGIVAGDVFDIVKGSKAGPISVKGVVTIQQLDLDRATFHVNAGKFGIKVDVTVELERVSDTEVRITSGGKGLPNMTELGRVVEQRENYALFEQINDPSKRTSIVHDGRGGIVIDTVIPTIGNAHLVLERR